MLSNAQIGQIIDLALAEDLGKGDITTNSLIPQGKVGVASILAKEKGILAGVEIAEEVFRRVDAELKIEVSLKDGAKVGSGDIIATVEGKVASIGVTGADYGYQEDYPRLKSIGKICC